MAEKRCPSCLREYDDERCSCGYPEKGENAAHQLPVGTILRGRYQIGKALGQGGFGITYLAWDTLMQEKVAVKEFYPGGIVFRRSAASTAVECSTEEIIPHYKYSKARFLREANALVKFKDIPEVVDILDFAEDNNTAYIVMEFVRGVDLAKYIAMKGGKLSVEETFRILRPVMEALAKVHKGGIVHRDISPDNIVLDPVGGAKLLDFGAVRIVEDPDVDKGLAKSTEAILKQGFAPLEQYNSRGSLGPWTDEYAVCATIWYCLTGKVPEPVPIRMAEGADPDWSSIPELPEHQQRALRKGFSCLAKDRYRSLDELLADLFPEKQALPIVEEPSVPVPAPGPDKIVDKRPKRGWIRAVVAVVLILAVAAAAILFIGPKSAPKNALSNQPQGPIGHTQPTVEQIPPTTEETAPSTEETEPPSEEEQSYLYAKQLQAEGRLGEAAIAFGKLAGYSDARERSYEIWNQIAFRDTIAAGSSHTVGLKTDGTVIALGYSSNGMCDVSGWSDIVAISAGSSHTVGLKTDGTVIAVGTNEYGQSYLEDWTDIVAISAGGNHTVGLCADGTVVAVGNNEDGQCNVADWTDIVAISAGNCHTVGLKADGTVVAAGKDEYGKCDVKKWSDIVAVSAGGGHTVALKADGSVVATGANSSHSEYYKGGQCDVGDWSDVVAIAAGYNHTVGLRANSTVLTAGFDMHGQCKAASWGNIVAIVAGSNHTVGLLRNGHVIAEGFNDYGQCRTSGWKNIRIPQRAPWYKQEAEAEPPEEETDPNRAAYTNAERLLEEGRLGEAAIAFGKLAGYADARERSFEIWAKIAVRDTVSTTHCHTVGLRIDGTVVAVGLNENGQCDLGDWTDIDAVSAGAFHTLGLKTDHTVVATGFTSNGRCDVGGWTDIVSVSAGFNYSVGLRADGTVVATGNNEYGQCDLGDWTDIVAVSAGGEHTVGLKADGTVVAIGKNDQGQCDVGDWTDIVMISCGTNHTVGLKSDGTAVAVGFNDEGPNYLKGGRCDVSKWVNLKAVKGGGWFTVGLTTAGNILLTGDLRDGRSGADYWLDIVAISTGADHIVGLRPDGKVWAAGRSNYGCCNVSTWKDILVRERPVPFR